MPLVFDGYVNVFLSGPLNVIGERRKKLKQTAVPFSTRSLFFHRESFLYLSLSLFNRVGVSEINLKDRALESPNLSFWVSGYSANSI